jgi:hypothetical protein
MNCHIEHAISTHGTVSPIGWLRHSTATYQPLVMPPSTPYISTARVLDAEDVPSVHP